MSTNNWIASSGSSWSVAADWSLGTVPTFDDDVVFASGFSNQACTCPNDITVKSLTISGYTGPLNWGTKTLTSSGNVIIGGAGAHTFGNVTISGTVGNFILNNGAITATSCLVTMSTSTSGSIQDNVGYQFAGLLINPSCTVYNIGSANSLWGSVPSPRVPLTIGANATFTSNSTIIDLRARTNGDFINQGASSTFNGTGQVQCRLFNSSLATTLTGINYTGTGKWTINDVSARTNNTVTLSSDLNIGNNDFDIVNTGSGSSTTFNANEKNITCGILSIGNSIAATMTFNASTGTHNIASYSNTYNTSTININLNSTTINCSGNFSIGSNHIVTPGTSTVNILNTSTVTTNGKYLNNLNCSGAVANTITLSDLTNLSGNFVASSGALTITSGLAFYGNNTSGIFNAGLGTVTATNCALSFNASGQVFTDNKGVAFKSLTINGVVTSNGTTATTFSTTTLPLTLGNGSIFTHNAVGTLNLTVNGGTFYSLPASYTWNGTGLTSLNMVGTCTIPALTKTTGATQFIFGGAATATVSGNLNLGTTSLNIYGYYAGWICTFNTGNFAITCGAYNAGQQAAGASAWTINYGSSVMTCSSYGATYNGVAPQYHNFQTSQWTCTGTWAFGSNHTVDAGSSIVNITNTSTITSSSKAFATLNLSGNFTGTFNGTPIISGNLGIYKGVSVNTTGDTINITSGCYITTTGTFASSGIYNIGKDLTFGSDTILNNSGMTINLSGQAHTITTGGRNFPYTKVYDNSTWVGSGTFARLTVGGNTTQTWQASTPYGFNSYVAGDWAGANLSNQILMRSSSTGIQTIFYSAPSTVTRFVDYKDINNLGAEIDASNGTNVDAGNNYGINFGGGVSHPRRQTDNNDEMFWIITKKYR